MSFEILSPKFIISRLLVLLLALIASGCAQTYYLKVDALKDPGFDANEVGATSYFIEPSRGSEAPQSLRFQESARLLEHTLGAKGVQRVQNREDADLIIEFGLSISNPMTATETRHEPVYYRSHGYVTHVQTPVYGSDGKVVRYVSTRVYIPPREEFAGYRERYRHITVYEKKLSISANIFSDGKIQDEVWTVSVTARDQESDLRGYLPYLLAAALPYIGSRTDGEVFVSLKEGDESVQWVRSGSF
jgi:hypothetical protein